MPPLSITATHISLSLNNQRNMQTLFRHIDQLLLRHECVIVPGVGGFLTHAAPSFYDEDEQAFYPPHRTIGFNAQLTLNDGTLVHSYMEAEKCDYKKASRLMQRDIQALQDAVRTHGECYIDGIGTLKQKPGDGYTFLPLEAGALTPSLFALPRFEIKPLPIANSSEKVITMKVSTVKRVASVAAAAVALVVLAVPIINGSGRQGAAQQQAASPMQAFTATGQDNDAYITTAETLKSIQTMFGEQEEEQAVLSQDHFTIVLACDVAPDNCSVYADMIRQEGGIDAAKLRVYDDHIYYGAYATHEAAAEALRLMQDNKYFKIGWVKEVAE